MTTYTLSGYGIQFPEDDGPTISVAPTTLQFVVPDGSTSFSYTILSTEQGSLAEVQPAATVYNIVLGGNRYTDENFGELNFEIGQVTRPGSTTYVMGADSGDFTDDFENVFAIGGTPFPSFASPSTVDSWIMGATSIGAASGAFGPNRDIAFSSLLGVSITENDSIVGTSGDDFFDGGAGNDTINPLSNDFGIDVIFDSAGDDTYVYSDVTLSSYSQLTYEGAAGPIEVVINGATNSGIIRGNGTDRLTDVANAMNWDGDGFDVIGTGEDDTFRVTTGSNQYIGLFAGGGDDSFVLNIDENSVIRLNFDWAGNEDASTGAVVDVAAGTISEDGFGGSDSLRVSGDGRLDLSGTDFADDFTGSNRNERFLPYGGDDTMDGADGFDEVRYDRNGYDAVFVDLEAGTATGTYDGLAFTDTLLNIEAVRGSREADDILVGNAEGNYLRGRGGNDTLEGGGGEDTLQGEDGDDTYTVDGRDLGTVHVDDGEGTNTLRIIDNPGFDTRDFYVDGDNLVWESTDGQMTVIHNWEGSFEMIEYTDQAQSQVRYSMEIITDLNDAGNTPFAFAGSQSAETVFAPTVNAPYGDAYLSGGDDTAFGSDDYTFYVQLGEGADILNGGRADDWARGQNGDDSLRGLEGEDSLWGGNGDDTLEGGEGNDLLGGAGEGADSIDGGDGIDTADYSNTDGRVLVDLQSDVSTRGFARFFTEGAGSGDMFYNVENATGGGGADNLRGDDQSNVLEGNGVSDRLYGRAGDDVMDGGLGADALYGNLGADIMTGGEDAGRRDRYIYFTADETGVGAGNRDVITDFVSGEDRIELSRIDADISQGNKQRFDFIEDDAFSGTGGELRFEQTGGITLVQADRDGDGAADFEIELAGTISLTDADFLI